MNKPITGTLVVTDRVHPPTCPYGQLMPEAVDGDMTPRWHDACNCREGEDVT